MTKGFRQSSENALGISLTPSRAFPLGEGPASAVREGDDVLSAAFAPCDARMPARVYASTSRKVKRSFLPTRYDASSPD